MAATVRQAAVIGGNRIPFSRSNGPYSDASNQDMLTATLDGLSARFGLARECVLGSALASDTPAFDIQQACDTGIQAAITVASNIALGKIESGIAGGVDTTSDPPIAINEDLRDVLVEANRTKSNIDRVKLLGRL